MAEKKPQSFENHGKYVPLYHFALLGFLFINLLWACWGVYRNVTTQPVDAIMNLLMALALILIAFYARIFALQAQDRVIRLEERLRFHELLPDDLRARIGELRRRQFIALRFASDEEIPELVRYVLDNNVRKGSEIKKRIKTWRPDYHRL